MVIPIKFTIPSIKHLKGTIFLRDTVTRIFLIDNNPFQSTRCIPSSPILGNSRAQITTQYKPNSITTIWTLHIIITTMKNNSSYITAWLSNRILSQTTMKLMCLRTIQSVVLSLRLPKTIPGGHPTDKTTTIAVITLKTKSLARSMMMMMAKSKMPMKWIRTTMRWLVAFKIRLKYKTSSSRSSVTQTSNISKMYWIKMSRRRLEKSIEN